MLNPESIEETVGEVCFPTTQEDLGELLAEMEADDAWSTQ